MFDHHPPTGMRTIRVRIPSAQEVFLLGEFNNWSTTATSMRAIEDDVWEATLPKSVELPRPAFFVWKKGERFGRIWPRWADNERALDGQQLGAVAV